MFNGNEPDLNNALRYSGEMIVQVRLVAKLKMVIDMGKIIDFGNKTQNKNKKQQAHNQLRTCKPYPITSFELTKWAIQQTPRIKTEKLVLIALCDCVNNKTGRCDPSILYLCKAAMCSKSVCIRAIKALEQQGFITTAKSAGIRTRYFINHTGIAHDTSLSETSHSETSTGVAHDTTDNKTSIAHDTTLVSPTTPKQSYTKKCSQTEKQAQPDKPAVEHHHNAKLDELNEIVGKAMKPSCVDKMRRYCRRVCIRNPGCIYVLNDCFVNKLDDMANKPREPYTWNDIYPYLKHSLKNVSEGDKIFF